MPNSQKNSSHVKAVAFIDFKPAELRINSQWLIVYYAKNPITQELQRFRVNVPAMKNKKERLQYAQKIVLEINGKLNSGWLPFYSDISSNDFKTFEYCKEQFLKQTEKEVATGNKRKDTLRSYTSFLNMIHKYIADKKIKLNLMFEFNKQFVVNYLDWIYYDRSNSPRTYNNHLLFIGTFVNYCVNRGYLKENFTITITKMAEKPKTRQVLTSIEKNKLKELQTENSAYYTLCMATYFCFIRRTELTKLKVSDINLNAGYISLSDAISKNKKSEVVTIPNAYLPILANHLQKANNTDYLFSDNNFAPGKKQLNPKKISDTWEKFRKQKNIEAKYQFYSLKDTGITDLLNTGIPAIKVRDQARHYDLKITESYTARNKNCDEVLRNSTFDF